MKQNSIAPMFKAVRFQVSRITRPQSLSPRRETIKTDAVSGWQELYVPPILIFLFSRVLLVTLAFVSPHVLGALHKNRPVLPHSDPLASLWSWTSPWFRFDAGWYVGIAQHGYHWGKVGSASTNFFPLYPLLIRILEPVTLGSPWLSALMIANVAFLLALILLWQWSLMHWGKDAALRVLLLTTVFPFAFFYVTPYAESLFLLFAVATFLSAERERWAMASISAALCASTRPVGVAVVVALLVMAIQRRDLRHSLFAVAAFVPLVAFIAYLTVAFGHPLAFLTYHSAGWVAPHGGLLETLGSQFHTHLSPLDRIDAAVAVLFLVSGIIVWRRLGLAYGLYVLIGVLLPLVHGLVSMERYVILLFPAFALWATWENRWGQFAIFALSLMLMVMATMMFAVGFSLF